MEDLRCLSVRKIICVDTETTQFLRVVVERETVGLLLNIQVRRREGLLKILMVVSSE